MRWGRPAHRPPRRSHPARPHSPIGSPDLAQDLGLQRHGCQRGVERDGSLRPAPTSCPPPQLRPLTPRHGSPYQPGVGSMGSAVMVRVASRHRLGRLCELLQQEEEEEEEEQVKEMINFLFLLKLGNRISGAAGQACWESSWQGGNPRKRGPCGSAGGHRGSIGPWVPFGGSTAPHPTTGAPSTAGLLAPAWYGHRDAASPHLGLPCLDVAFPTQKYHLGDRKAGFGLVGMSCTWEARAGDRSSPGSRRCSGLPYGPLLCPDSCPMSSGPFG